jgi:hypothetical protein
LLGTVLVRLGAVLLLAGRGEYLEGGVVIVPKKQKIPQLIFSM